VDTLKFPATQVETPAESGASRFAIWRSRLKEWFCWALNRLGAPGAVRDVEIEDGGTGQKIEVRVGVLFTRISVNGRDYYFRRLTGRFDGTGSGCA
jgi:hypothetical protein